MAAFESQKKSARNLVLSPNKQTAPGELMADGNLTRRQRFDGSAVFEMVPSFRSDKDMSGKGTEFATDQQQTGWDTKFSFKASLDDWLAGWAFAFAMGKDTVTGAGPYVHTIAWDETTTQAPMTCVYLEDTAAVKFKGQDIAVSDLTLTIPERGACTLETSFVGTGRWTDGAMGAVPALPTDNYILGSDCVFSIGPTGAPVAVTGRLMNGTIKLATAVESHKAPGGGLYGFFMRTGLRKFSTQQTIAAKDTDDIRTLLTGHTASELKWVITSGANIVSIDIPFCYLKTTKLGVSGNMVVWQIEVDETTCLNVGGAGAINVIVTNQVSAAYLVGA